MANMKKSDCEESKKLVLGSLLNNASTQSKKVLNSYNYAASYKTNLEKMKSNNATLLEACATYLGFVVRENDKKLYKNQEILCDRLILKLNLCLTLSVVNAKKFTATS